MDHVFLYQHTKRSEWGYGAVIGSQDDRTTFKFDDGVSRTIKRDHIHMMVRVELEEPQASEVRKRIAKPVKSAAAAAATAKKAAKKKSTAAAAKPIAAAEAEAPSE